MNSKFFFQQAKPFESIFFTILFGLYFQLGLNAQMDKSFTNTLGQHNSAVSESYVNSLISGYNNVNSSGRTFQSTAELVNYLNVPIPQYIKLTDYLVNRPSYMLGHTVLNHINNAISISDFRNRLAQIPITGLTYDDKTFLAVMDYTAQFIGNTNLGYVSGAGGNKVIKLIELGPGWWKCALNTTAGGILGGLTGAGGGSVIPGVGTAIGGVVGIIAGGYAAWSAAGCDDY